jgi:hypothetical protein
VAQSSKLMLTCCLRLISSAENVLGVFRHDTGGLGVGSANLPAPTNEIKYLGDGLQPPKSK